MLTLAIVLFPFLCKGQTNDTAFDFEKAEQLLETLMQQDISDADALRLFLVNLGGTMHTAKKVLPHMLHQHMSLYRY